QFQHENGTVNFNMKIEQAASTSKMNNKHLI
ncbi:unnamed protein product, partial [Rotaria sp. Silwood1]